MPQIFRMGNIGFGQMRINLLNQFTYISPKESLPKMQQRYGLPAQGKCLLCNNNSRIPSHTLRNIMRMIEARSADIIQSGFAYFGEISYYC